MRCVLRRGDRVVEGTGLENRRASNGTEGSNPSLSAIKRIEHLLNSFYVEAKTRARGALQSSAYRGFGGMSERKESTAGFFFSKRTEERSDIPPSPPVKKLSICSTFYCLGFEPEMNRLIFTFSHSSPTINVSFV